MHNCIGNCLTQENRMGAVNNFLFTFCYPKGLTSQTFPKIKIMQLPFLAKRLLDLEFVDRPIQSLIISVQEEWAEQTECWLVMRVSRYPWAIDLMIRKFKTHLDLSGTSWIRYRDRELFVLC